MVASYRTSSFITLSLKTFDKKWQRPVVAIAKKLKASQCVIRYETGASGTHPHLHLLLIGHTRVRTDHLRERFYTVFSEELRQENPKWFHNARVPLPLHHLSYMKKSDTDSKYLYVHNVKWAKVPEWVPNPNKVLLDSVYKKSSVILNRKTFCRFVLEFYRSHECKFDLSCGNEFDAFMILLIQQGVNFDELIVAQSMNNPSAYTYYTIFDKYSSHIVNLLEYAP